MRVKNSFGDTVFMVVVAAILVIFAVLCLYPFVYSISVSLSGDSAIVNNSVYLLPQGFSLDSYKLVFSQPTIMMAYWNTVRYTVVGTLISLAMTLSYGYMLSKKDFVFHRIMLRYSIVVLLFSGGLIPWFIVINKLRIYNTIWAIVLPGAVSVWNALIARTFFQTTIPESVTESAIIDGCGDFSVFIRIVLPLSKPLIAILALYAGVGFWNDYFNALLLLKDSDKAPLQLLLSHILTVQQQNSVFNSFFSDGMAIRKNVINAQRMKYVMIVVSSAPIILIYPFLQRYFVKGVMLGSIKG